MSVGLYGGSFDPAHHGHAHVAETAVRRLRLDRLVWLVSPRNPLKLQAPGADLLQRMAGARRLARGPAMIVSDLEARIGARYTIDTLRFLKRRFPGVRFVLVVGGDNLAGLHRWRSWADIMRAAPLAVIARPGFSLQGLSSPAARRFARARWPASAAARLTGARPPAWVYLPAPLNPTSSTALRRRTREEPDQKSPLTVKAAPC